MNRRNFIHWSAGVLPLGFIGNSSGGTGLISISERALLRLSKGYMKWNYVPASDFVPHASALVTNASTGSVALFASITKHSTFDLRNVPPEISALFERSAEEIQISASYNFGSSVTSLTAFSIEPLAWIDRPHEDRLLTYSLARVKPLPKHDDHVDADRISAEDLYNSWSSASRPQGARPVRDIDYCAANGLWQHIRHQVQKVDKSVIVIPGALGPKETKLVIDALTLGGFKEIFLSVA